MPAARMPPGHTQAPACVARPLSIAQMLCSDAGGRQPTRVPARLRGVDAATHQVVAAATRTGGLSHGARGGGRYFSAVLGRSVGRANWRLLEPPIGVSTCEPF